MKIKLDAPAVSLDTFHTLFSLEWRTLGGLRAVMGDSGSLNWEGPSLTAKLQVIDYVGIAYTYIISNEPGGVLVSVSAAQFRADVLTIELYEPGQKEFWYLDTILHWLTTNFGAYVVDRKQRNAPLNDKAFLAQKEPSQQQITGLTARLTEVLMLLLDGMRQGEIAEHLMIASNTIKTYLKEIANRWGMNSYAQDEIRKEAQRRGITGGKKPPVIPRNTPRNRG